MTALKKQQKEELKNKYINRELSWLKFNDRVLFESQNIENPLYERVKFLSIAGSNLDEFFMVRVAGLYSQIKQEVDSLSSDGLTPDEQMEEQFVDFVIDEALSEKEESMLMEQLEANPELSMIFDKVIEKASEFTGAGEVEGPGTGTSDSIPARLSDGEFVFTAKSVEQIGADNLMKMMKDAEAAYDAGEDREKMQEGGLQEMSMDMERDMPNKKEVEVTYNVNRPETVSTVQPLLAREQEEDLITQKLKEDMLGPSKMR